MKRKELRKSLIVLVFMSLTYGFNAQQLPMYSQFFWNDFAINPAYTGLTNTNRIQLGYRNQWSGFAGAPSTFTLGGHTLLKKQNIGLGGMIFLDDGGGALRQTGAMLNYSYILKLNRSSNLSMALSGIINQYSYDGSEIQNIDPDPTLSGSVSQLAPDMSFGLVYALQNKLFVGFGINQLIQSKLSKFNELNTLNIGANRLVRHYHLTASYSIPVNEKIQLDPYVLMRSTFINPPQFELGVKSTVNEMFFFGLNYRHKESAIAMLGVNYKNAVLAYSYDISLSDIGQYSNGSHEVLLAYQFGKSKEKEEPVVEESDRDKDGILDKDDLCPDVKGLAEFKGCPDTDGDGIFDKIDDCPETPGPKDNNGCPYPDTDEDGLLDKDDDCPNTPGPKENNGCPYEDTDGDGLLDKDDDCPQTAGPVENRGCPVIEEKEQEVLNTAFDNLEFETNLDVIKNPSKPALIELANTLKLKLDWKLQLTGHTDNVGDDDLNMILSKKRAEAVKKFLTAEGIDEGRIKVLFYGENKPIEENDTEAGRQKNRRVEFKIIFD